MVALKPQNATLTLRNAYFSFFPRRFYVVVDYYQDASLIPHGTQGPRSKRQARCKESSGIAPETAVGCPITRGATGHVRITIVKMQGSLRDIREAWVSVFLAGKEKPHRSEPP